MIRSFDFHGRRIDPSILSKSFSVCPLTEEDAETVYLLCRENTLYYQHCPPFVTPDSIRRDMKALPPGKQPEDKYYLGYFSGETLIAVLDLISGYPDPETAFIGFFMTGLSLQRQGTGSRIIRELCEALKGMSYREVRLCWVRGNPQAEAFWHKNGFSETGVSYNTDGYTVIVGAKKL